LIADGRIHVNGTVVRRSSVQVGDADTVGSAGADNDDYASRGGHKLAGALASWPELEIAGRICLDAGASHGGFTDVLLRRGARRVYAVDVGVGQLRPALAADERVVVRDACNVRTLTPDQLGATVDVTVCDLSFISLAVVLPALIACTDTAGDLVPMVKPQFEVGRGRHARGGVVRSGEVRADAVFAVAAAAAELGWGTRGVCRSVLPGPAGNVEFFLWLRTDAPAPDRPALRAATIAP
jgi:23S rRNA (cytidine1920-2'-O)/16S rRNA (cytidine1409-2'-O)-methyltransferase